VPNHEFVFSVTVSKQRGFDEMLADLAACVLNQLGYGPSAIAEMLGEVRGALARTSSGGALDCETMFFARDGQLTIVVTVPGGREWRTARPLPSAP
jgi:hypothetical protein